MRPNGSYDYPDREGDREAEDIEEDQADYDAKGGDNDDDEKDEDTDNDEKEGKMEKEKIRRKKESYAGKNPGNFRQRANTMNMVSDCSLRSPQVRKKIT